MDSIDVTKPLLSTRASSVDSGGEWSHFLLLRFDLIEKNRFAPKAKLECEKDVGNICVRVPTIVVVSFCIEKAIKNAENCLFLSLGVSRRAAIREKVNTKVNKIFFSLLFLFCFRFLILLTVSNGYKSITNCRNIHPILYSNLFIFICPSLVCFLTLFSNLPLLVTLEKRRLSRACEWAVGLGLNRCLNPGKAVNLKLEKNSSSLIQGLRSENSRLTEPLNLRQTQEIPRGRSRRERSLKPEKNSVKNSDKLYRDDAHLRSIIEMRIRVSLDVEENPGPNQDRRPAAPDGSTNRNKRIDAQLKVTSYNVRGLNDESKLRHLINHCYKTVGSKDQDSIYCFQETFIENSGKIPYLWRGNHFLTPGRGNSSGCLTLLSSHLNVVDSRLVEDRGHVLACQRIGDQNVTYIIANIYAPNPNNAEKIDFFEKVLNEVSELEMLYSCTKSIVVGDYNLTFRVEESKNRRFTAQEKNVSRAVKQMLSDLGLKDIWEKNVKFTWRRANSDSFSTIDRVFFAANEFNPVISETNWSLSFSDHAAVEIHFNMKNTKPSPPKSRITRLDPSVISDPATRPIIIEEICRLINLAQENWNPHLKLDYAKMCVRTVLEKAQADRKLKEKTEEDYLDLELDLAIKALGREDLQANGRLELIDLIETLRNKKAVLVDEKGKRLADKLGTKWYNEGEKSNKYFLRLLNRINPDKFVALENEAGELVTDEDDIEKEIVAFYKELYEEYEQQTSDDDPSFFDEISGLENDDERSVCGEISLEELSKTLATCKDSAPGPDGIPYSIIRALWQPLGQLLVNAWNHSLRTGELPQSHRVSFLKLIPKIGKDGKKLTNWRPITLSNCDHKIITKVYATRMSEKIEKCIKERQTAYLKGRMINDNIRSLLATIKLANVEENIDGLIVSLDAKKAFDSVEHSYIEKVLVKFGLAAFVPIFKVLYSNLSSDIIINGRIVKGFKIKRGVKQGDALSCILFIMCMEPLLRNIESNARIKSLKSEVLNSEVPKLYAYADDVNSVIKNDQESLQEMFREYERLTNLSGLQLNADKTEILPIKSTNIRNFNPLYVINYKNETHRLKPCTSTKINGIIFQQDESELRQANVDNVVRKTDEQLKKWSRRGLSILGKILIVKTFGVSQIVYLMQSMNLSDADFKKLKHILYKFIWNRHYLAAKAPERIKREITNKPILEGGLGMLAIEDLDASLKLRALGRLKGTKHPMLKLLRDMLDVEDFFFPEDKSKLDSVLERAVHLLRENRQDSWKDNEFNREKHYVDCIKSINQ